MDLSKEAITILCFFFAPFVIVIGYLLVVAILYAMLKLVMAIRSFCSNHTAEETSLDNEDVEKGDGPPSYEEANKASGLPSYEEALKNERKSSYRNICCCPYIKN